ncbi:uncharacterized protein LOC124287290 isoform X1 [Haliotis rubra]|uniref:uncharacterized protein LOC124287290 isoform X1 n=1 Tax=Haliotis rubra TaxID=36100 RepID=UPI001EE5D9D9|nr:uncharacterized protein LOC124287290 isoform X1 [Haliotis rubra]
MNCDKEMLLTSQRAATILFQAGVDFEANWPSGVRVYKRVNEEQMKMVSSILTSKKPKTEEVPCKAEHKASTPEGMFSFSQWKLNFREKFKTFSLLTLLMKFNVIGQGEMHCS